APANVLVSTVRALSETRRDGPRVPISHRVRQAPHAPGARPHVLVLVVGETVRAQNWGLNGYARQTTPELARRSVINFRDVTACGSSTEVSLP
ncbi:sulfatase-like hydrolase/transferase, partial [Salmonella enterica]|uniref:sulfatase-like hydrolase/transferase n=1 Tax=Salmonella enterica TaxID=28901 RepID=UPI0022B62D1A